MGFSNSSLLFSFQLLCLLSIFHFLYFSLPAYALLIRNNETDRLALIEFKAKITGDPLGVMTSWNSSLHFCQWYGVKCGRRHQRVTMLDLSSVKLSGSISPYIGNLSFLRRLFIENNSFTHEIPPQIGHLHRLQIFSLINNSFTGQIPPSISNCSKLITIDLLNNKLVGEIPASIGFLLKLEFIQIRNNNLTGTLPPSLGNLSSLQQFFVNGNNLHGIVLATLGQLMNLRLLTLSRNQFSGTIPPSIFNLSSIQGIDVAYNQLLGNLPLDLGISLPNLKFFSIVNNKFTGSLPTSISNASNLEILQLGENNFSGRIPSLDKLRRFRALNLYNNSLGTGKADDLKFLSTLSNATNLIIFSIGFNNFGGMLPQQFCNFSKKLQTFFIAYNQILGKIPPGIGDCIELRVLDMGGNRMTGNIPSSIGKLQTLGELLLDHNDFFGAIPSILGNLTNLLEISLSGNKFQGIIPSTLANCNNLLALELSNNNLTGPIPQQIFRLSSLSISLDLSQNHLSSSIPNEVENLKNIAFLDLSDNIFSGEIPSGLSSCKSLQFLYMDANLLQGSIPSSLSSLRGLQELNLSHNTLSGKIPEFLKDFIFLQLLDLSDNDFEGMVPIQGVFKNATATSITGNKNLCGGTPEFGLPPCKLQQSKGGLTGKLKIIISTVSLLIFVALVLISIFLCHSRKRKEESTPSYEYSLLKLSYQSLLKATNGFSSNNLIGTGSFGSVYKGVLDQEGIVIAVKVLNLTRKGASKSFVAECEALRNIRHRNLVKVLTACSGVDYHGNDFKALVYDFMVNGSLDGWLHQTHGLEEPQRTLSVLQRMNIAIDVACALEYLHHHCDLKPSNVLLNEEMTGHVSDFGLMKFLSDGPIIDQFSSIGIRGTIGYCPPEYGVGSEVSTAGDIFSFGILLLEMFTGKRSTDDTFKEGLSLHNFVKKALPEHVTQVIDSNLLQMQLNDDATLNYDKDFGSSRKSKFIECLISIFEIGISCSVELPQDRMGIGDIVMQLTSIRNKLLGDSITSRERR